MRASRHTAEHKLEFSSYLHGESGGILLAKMTKETGQSREDLLALLGAVRPLEFYIPVPEHRENWRGDDNLLVASLLEDHTVPTAYTLKGEPVMLDAERHPLTPTLGIVPVETNFSRPLDSKVPNRRDQGGQTIGTYCMECVQPIDEDGSGGGGGGGSSLPQGIYMEYSVVFNDGEGWLKGAPEIEVHLHGPNDNTREGKDLSCSGESRSGLRYFNQDHGTWSGRVLLYSQSELDELRYLNGGNDPEFHILMWEDDDTRCVIKTDKDRLINALLATSASLGVNASKAAAVAIGCPACAPVLVGVNLALQAFHTASWLKTADDYLGDIVEVSQGTYTDANHKLDNGGNENGRVRIIRR
jgi:hypothetical protein